MGVDDYSKRRKTHWSEVGVQGKEECKRRNQEIQRLVVKGYSQRPGIDYGEVFDSVCDRSKHIDTRYHFIRE